jgi:hypothetical protein
MATTKAFEIGDLGTNLQVDASGNVTAFEITTSEVDEGTNLYYTDARARSAISVSGNLTYDSGTGILGFTMPTTIASLSNHDTDDLAEGTGNLYFTSARARASLTGGTGITYSSSTGQIELTASGVTAGSYGSASQVPQITVDAYGRITSLSTTSVAGVTDFDYNTSTGVLDIDTADGGNFATTITLAPFDTGDLAEGSRLYYTDARARAAVSATGSLSYNSSTGVFSYTQGNTDTVAEGSTNLYFTNARARTAISATGSLSYNSTTGVMSFTQGNTDTVAEGSTNLYFTNARANSAITKATIDALNVDADTLDGLNSTQFLRSDANDTTTGTLTIGGGVLSLLGGDNTTQEIQLLESSGSHGFRLRYTGADTNYFQLVGVQSGGSTTIFDVHRSGTALDFKTTPTVNGSNVLTTANEGSGNGIDADTVDGLQASQFLRSDTSDTMTGDLTLTSSLTTNNRVYWQVSSSDNARVQADARDFGSDTVLHWHNLGEGSTSATSFKQAWWDGSRYINVFTEGGGVSLTSTNSDTTFKIGVSDTISQSRIAFADSSGTDGIITYDHNQRKMHIGAGTSTATDGDIVIDSAGNVGIGASSPAAKLDVDGQIKAGTLRLTSTVDNIDGNDRGSRWAYDPYMALSIEPQSDGQPVGIIFPSAGNSPSDFSYIVYDEDYGEAGVSSDENAALIIGSENDGTSSSDHVRVKGRLVVDAMMHSGGQPDRPFEVKNDNVTTNLFAVDRAGHIQLPVGSSDPTSRIVNGSCYYNPTAKTFNIYNANESEWGRVTFAELGSFQNPATSGIELMSAGLPTGQYWISVEGYVPYLMYVNNDDHGGGWVMTASARTAYCQEHSNNNAVRFVNDTGPTPSTTTAMKVSDAWMNAYRAASPYGGSTAYWLQATGFGKNMFVSSAATVDTVSSASNQNDRTRVSTTFEGSLSDRGPNEGTRGFGDHHTSGGTYFAYQRHPEQGSNCGFKSDALGESNGNLWIK